MIETKFDTNKVFLTKHVIENTVLKCILSQNNTHYLSINYKIPYSVHLPKFTIVISGTCQYHTLEIT